MGNVEDAGEMLQRQDLVRRRDSEKAPVEVLRRGKTGGHRDRCHLDFMVLHSGPLCRYERSACDRRKAG